ncbi:MAG: hypothetical protein GXP04_05645 [Alphaproteobacteria bacterium]|nr:hypothetical protein [Alphaproteobacteria bacterium]
MKRLFIVDPSLKDLRGHHYALMCAATLSAKSLGFEVYWLCSTQYSDARRIDGVTIDPTFNDTMYESYMMPPQRGGLVGKLRSFAAGLFLNKNSASPKRISPALSFRRDLQAALARHNADEQDRIFIHTADGVIFRAIAELLLAREGAQLPIFHVATPYNPTGVMPNKGSWIDISEGISALQGSDLIDSKIFLYGENTQLAEHLASHWSVCVRTLELPVQPREARKLERAQAYRREVLGLSDDVFLIVSLGAARLEKGFHHFPEIVRHTAELAGRDDYPDADLKKIKFVLHASPQIIGRHPEIVAAIEKLNAMPRAQVELILEPLSDTDYENLLHASDAIMMPYSKKDYGIRGSMIVSEAIAAAKSIIATAGTYPGYAAAEAHGCAAGTPQEFAESVLEISADREAFKESAERISAEFVARNTVEGYWKKCLDAELAGEQ